MKSLMIALTLTLSTSLVWGGIIVDSTNNLNPLMSPASTSQTIAQLAGMEVIFNFGSFTETAFFNGATGEAASANGFLVLFGANLGSNVDASNWLVQTDSPALLGVTILGSGPGLPGLTAFDTTVEAVCGDPTLCPVNATGLYSSPIAIGGDPAGSLFGTLSLTFANPGVTPTTSFFFQADTQLLTAPVTEPALATPEPSSLPILASSLLLAVLAGWSRSRDVRKLDLRLYRPMAGLNVHCEPRQEGEGNWDFRSQ